MAGATGLRRGNGQRGKQPCKGCIHERAAAPPKLLPQRPASVGRDPAKEPPAVWGIFAWRITVADDCLPRWLDRRTGPDDAKIQLPSFRRWSKSNTVPLPICAATYRGFGGGAPKAGKGQMDKRYPQATLWLGLGLLSFLNRNEQNVARSTKRNALFGIAPRPRDVKLDRRPLPPFIKFGIAPRPRDVKLALNVSIDVGVFGIAPRPRDVKLSAP